MGRSLFDETAIQVNLLQILPADTTTLKQLASSQFPDFRIDNLLLSNTDTIDHVIDFWFQLSATNYLIGSINVPTLSGTGGLAAVDAIPHLIAAGQQGLPMNNSTVLYISAEVTVGAGKIVHAMTIGGRF
jgi:hypothetical protein